MIGANRTSEPQNKNSDKERVQENYHPFSDHFPGVWFQLDENFMPVSIEGPVEEVSGYGKDEILSGKITLTELVVPEDQPSVFENRKKLKSNPRLVIENELRIRKKTERQNGSGKLSGGESRVLLKAQETSRAWLMISLNVKWLKKRLKK